MAKIGFQVDDSDENEEVQGFQIGGSSVPDASDSVFNSTGLTDLSSSNFSGVAKFVDFVKGPPVERSVFRRVDTALSFDFDHDGIPDDVELDEEAEDELKQAFGQAFRRPLSTGENQKVVNRGREYTKIHNVCKYRLFNMLDIEKPEKSMTLGQLREIMAGCLEGKKARDEQCRAQNSNLITLENYLFEFLEQRHNSDDPDEIREWSLALSKAIQKFGVFESEVNIFGKMARNMLSETFPNRQRVLRQTFEKKMSENLSANVWSKRNYDGVPLSSYEAVISHMFNQKDAHEIMKRVKDPLPKTGKRGTANLEALSRDPPYTRYQHCLETLLTFNLNLQDDFLHDFNVAYRKIDVRKDGVLSIGDVQDLVQKFGTLETVKEGSSAHLLLEDAKVSTLRAVRRSRRLTFSETVDRFTDLLSARWSITGKKGTRYQHHDNLKNLLGNTTVDMRKKSLAQVGAEQLKSALKKIKADETASNEKRKKNISYG
jgi:hypothetical protein